MECFFSLMGGNVSVCALAVRLFVRRRRTTESGLSRFFPGLAGAGSSKAVAGSTKLNRLFSFAGQKGHQGHAGWPKGEGGEIARRISRGRWHNPIGDVVTRKYYYFYGQRVKTKLYGCLSRADGERALE